jgi:hypothetical protein
MRRQLQRRVGGLARRKITEVIVRTFILAAAFASALTAGAIAQTYDPQTYDPSPRDPPLGKGNPGNDTFHLPSQADIGWRTSNNSMGWSDISRYTRGRKTRTIRTP